MTTGDRSSLTRRCATVAIYLAALLAGSATDDGLVFYCAYDGTADATFACGDKAATCAIAPEFQPGVRGQAVVIGGPGTLPAQNPTARNCYYSPDGNFAAQQGTVSFWLKPLDWDGKTKGFNVFFRTGFGANYFMLYRYWSDDRFLFLRGEQGRWTDAMNRVGGWKMGLWHHVAATWSPAETRLYIDGAMVCTRRVRFPLGEPTPVEPLSVGPGGSWEKAFTGRSLMDELRIHNRPLSDADVVQLYRRDADAVELDTGLLTVGERTPVLDGRIADFEYSLTNRGFYSLGKAGVRPQSTCALSYDRTNLYLAVESELGPTLAAAAERVELFLCTGDAARTCHHYVFTPADGPPVGGTRVQSTVLNKVWTLEAAIPFADLGLERAPDGQQWRVNLGRVFTAPEEITSLAPVKGSLDDRSQFVTLAFRPDAPAIRIASWRDLVAMKCASDVSVQSTHDRSTIRLESVTDTTTPYGLRTRSIPLFAEGKATPFRSPVWAISADFLVSESRIVETLDGKESTLYRRTSIHEDQSPMKTLFLYTQAKQRLLVSASHRAEGDIQARFLRPDGSCAFQARQAIPSAPTYFQAAFDLDFTKLTPGHYTIKIDYVAPDGTAIETWEQAYRIPRPDDPDFLPYVDEDADKVPAPWTPLQSGDSRAEVWGRAYGFSAGILFSSLVSQGKEILAAPATLRLDGTPLAGPTEIRKGSATDLTAEWEKRAHCGKVEVESRIRTHFDGYCEVAVTLCPSGGARELTTLSLDIPLRGDVARLVRDNRISSLEGGKSGRIGDYWCQDLAGRGSFLWVGNERVGFNWLAQSLDGWNCRDTAKAVEIIRQGDTAILRFNLVDTPVTLSAPRTITFGFILTPSRPLDRRIVRLRNHRELQMWCQPWQYFAYPDYDTANRAQIERDGAGAKELFLYMSDGITSPFSPEWAWWEEDWRSFRGGTRTFGDWTGDAWELVYRNRCCYVEANGTDTFVNFLQHKRHEFFERAKTPLTPQARNYYFDDGATTSLGYRERALTVYRMIKRTGPDAKIWGHQGWLRVMPMQHFADIICGGEAVEQRVGRDGGYYQVLTPEGFRASFSPTIWGMKTVFLYLGFGSATERNLSYSLQNPADRLSVLHAYGYALVHDVDIHNETPLCAQLIQELMRPLWAAQDTLVWDENVTFFPYWENDVIKLIAPESDRVMASAYSNHGKLLLAVLNDTDQEQNVKLALDLRRLGVKPGLPGHDVWEPERRCTLSPAWLDTMPPRGFRLVVIDGE